MKISDRKLEVANFHGVAKIFYDTGYLKTVHSIPYVCGCRSTHTHTNRLTEADGS
jgi:hypothetical protein